MPRTLCNVYSMYGKTAGDNFLDRMTGRTGEAAQRKAATSTITQFALDRYGPGVRVSWSQRLGCSCGCSPGWRVYIPDINFKDPDWVVKQAAAPAVLHQEDCCAGSETQRRRGGFSRKVSAPLKLYLEDDSNGNFSVRTAGKPGHDQQLFPLPGSSQQAEMSL